MKCIALLTMLILFVFAECSIGKMNHTPGYNGPIVSVKGQQVIQSLSGSSFLDMNGSFGGGQWTIGNFAVIPNPRTGKGPVVEIKQGDTVLYLPVESDGDVVDLYQRVHGQSPKDINGKMSENYKKAWMGKK